MSGFSTVEEGVKHQSRCPAGCLLCSHDRIRLAAVGEIFMPGEEGLAVLAKLALRRIIWLVT